MFAPIAVLVGIAITACGSEEVKMPLSRVTPPEGGTVCSLHRVQTSESEHLTAVTEAGLFTRKVDNTRWQYTPVRLQAPSSLTGLPNASRIDLGRAIDRWDCSQVSAAAQQGQFWIWIRANSSSNFFVRTTGAPQNGTWTSVPTPEGIAKIAQTGPSPPNSNASKGLSALRSVELSSVSSNGLTITSGNRVWRLEDPTRANQTPPAWKPVVQKLPEQDARQSGLFEQNIYRYLPRSEKRPEILVISGKHPAVYRRFSRNADWERIRTLEHTVRDVRAFAQRAEVWILTDGNLHILYPGDSKPKQISLPSSLDAQPTSLLGVETPPSPQPVPLLGTSAGAIYKKSGTDWSQVDSSPAKAMLRNMRRFDDTLFALYDNQGLKSSSSSGESWSLDNQGLTASSANCLEIIDQQLYVGTNAGLFSLTGSPTQGHWNKLHSYPTTAIASVDPNSNRVVSGTRRGKVLFRGTKGDLSTMQIPTKSVDAEISTDAITEISPRIPGAPDHVLVAARGRGIWHLNLSAKQWSQPAALDAFKKAVSPVRMLDADTGDGTSMHVALYSSRAPRSLDIWGRLSREHPWKHIHTLPLSKEVPYFIAQARVGWGEPTVLLAADNRLTFLGAEGNRKRSVELSGASTRIVGYDVDRDQIHNAMIRNPYRDSLRTFKFEGSTMPTPIATVQLEWPELQTGSRPRVRQITRTEQDFFVRTRSSIWTAVMAEDRHRTRRAVTIILTITLLGIVSACAFVSVKTMTNT